MRPPTKSMSTPHRDSRLTISLMSAPPLDVPCMPPRHKLMAHSLLNFHKSRTAAASHNSWVWTAAMRS